jgi:hypothetical protein
MIEMRSAVVPQEIRSRFRKRPSDGKPGGLLANTRVCGLPKSFPVMPRTHIADSTLVDMEHPACGFLFTTTAKSTAVSTWRRLIEGRDLHAVLADGRLEVRHSRLLQV